MTSAHEALISRYDAFRGFLEKRVEGRATAEDILQQVWVRLSEAKLPPDDDGAVRFFYRALRNALVDHYRRRSAAGRALEANAALTAEAATAPEPWSERCKCVEGVMAGLEPSQRVLLQWVDLDGVAPADVAAQLGISAGNARVRLHRARQALKNDLVACCGKCSETGCLDCGCNADRAAASAGPNAVPGGPHGLENAPASPRNGSRLRDDD